MTRTASRALPEDFCALVMAAGQGTRMRSEIAKVLHPLSGLPMVAHVLELCQALAPKRTLVVIGHQAEHVRAALGTYAVEFIHQAEQRGTAHAVLMAETALEGFSGDMLVINGDVPLLSKQLIERVLQVHRDSRAQATVVTTKLADPRGYGRVLRDRAKGFKGIVEEVEATPAQRKISEINAGIYCFRAQPLFAALHQVRPSAVKGELYLPEVLQLLRAGKGRIATVFADDSREVLGINTRAELAEAAGVLRRRIVDRLMDSGVTCLDPAATYVSVLASVGRDTVLYPGAQIEGRSEIGEGCTIHSGARIRDSRLGNRVTVLDGSVILDSEIADEAILGPYAHLRPGNRLSRKTKIGNFVELKKSLVGPGSKIPHLTYVGDSVVGERVNIGAGTITCNYDGFTKSQTIIEDEVFIGSNSCLVAPVAIRRGAYVAAGSTITDEVPSDALAFGRARQTNKGGLAAVIRRNKAELKAKKESGGH